ncbi:MAG: NADH-quinone oxidoreductase subunit A [Archaeoglobaceae archaeon]
MDIGFVESTLVIAVIVAVALLTAVAVLILAKIFPKYTITDVKIARFEAGNVPIGWQKSKDPMQYIGFMLLFMSLEPVTVLILLFAAFPSIDVYALTLTALIMFIPAIYVGYRYAVEIAKLR